VTAFADLTSPALGALVEGDRTVVALLPLGAVEPHGPHAPLGTDNIISAGVCARAAEMLAEDPRLQPLVLPALPYGVTRYAAAFPGAVTISEETLRALVAEIARSLADQGIAHLVLVNNHFEPEQVQTLRSVGVTLLDLTRRRQAERLTEEFRSGSCHAGRYETSLVLADAPGLVDRERMSGLPENHVDMPAAIADGLKEFEAMGMRDAYCGAPAEATAEEGEVTFATLAGLLVELIREVAC
jgi:creatinine amidohydrolase